MNNPMNIALVKKTKLSINECPLEIFVHIFQFVPSEIIPQSLELVSRTFGQACRDIGVRRLHAKKCFRISQKSKEQISSYSTQNHFYINNYIRNKFIEALKYLGSSGQDQALQILSLLYRSGHTAGAYGLDELREQIKIEVS